MPLKLNIYSGTGIIELQDANNGILQFSFSGQVSISESSNTHTNVYGHLLEYGRKVNFEAEIFETSKEIIDNLVLRKDVLQTIKITGLETVVTITNAIIVFDISRQYPNKTHKIILKSSTLKDNVNISVGINPLFIPDASTVTQYWFNSLNETPLEDLSGNGHTLTPSANFDWQDQFNNSAPQGGNALYFDGTDDYFETPDSTDLNFGENDFCIEVILKNELPPSTVSYFSKGEILSPGFHAFLDPARGTNGQVVLRLNGAGNEVAFDVADYQGNYNYLAFVRTGTIISIYLNGSPMKSNDIGIDNIDNTYPLYIGVRYYDGDGLNRFFNSDYSEFLLSNNHKTPEQIQATWDRIKGYF